MASRERSLRPGSSPARSRTAGTRRIIGISSSNLSQCQRTSSGSPATARRASVRNRSDETRSRPRIHRRSSADSASTISSFTNAEASRNHTSPLVLAQFGKAVTDWIRVKRQTKPVERCREIVRRRVRQSLRSESLQGPAGRDRRPQPRYRTSPNRDLVALTVSDPPQPPAGVLSEFANTYPLHVLHDSTWSPTSPLTASTRRSTGVRRTRGDRGRGTQVVTQPPLTSMVAPLM